MRVILQKDVQNLGEAGDIKEVAEGFARNFLLPKKLVIPYNESSAKAIEHQKKLVKIKKEKRKKEGQKLAEALSSVALTIGAQVGEDDKLFGSVTAIDIADKLLQMGYTIDKRKIVLPEPIKKAGEYEVKIKLEEGLTATIKVSVVKE
ncbi:MAG TPA: 50S ribosomal protein L9 [Spirochaetota bacterium]|nr:50S ribosomal protein L9 [Spirochaetota bacterium]HOM87100.1 50S ribosomal protein L9 [Spirochaetota bacterium]HOR92596.1 50S ribosomal protein L9 [Spirochaetota bacterium]HOT19302.1 50S ribosomal protein L9 [Spirochaetota bacterium]HPD04018.1 50S ribosomal protein L9 [Spirochaetota bacterium]